MDYKYLIGGEFSTNKFYFNKNILNKFHLGSWTLNGRYALELIFKNNPSLCNKTIYLPIYNCPSTYNVIKKYFKKIIFYDLKKSFKPKVNNFKKNSILILVSYFGHKVNFIPRKDLTIIEDLTHLILDQIQLKKNRFYFVSLRKYGIFNFGGWTNICNNNIKYNKINIFHSYRKKKFNYLTLKKKDLKNEYKLLKLLSIEEKKLEQKKICIPKESIKLITNKSEKKIKIIRNSNYMYLKKNVKINYLRIPYKKNETPMFFILKFSCTIERNKVRKILTKENIFCPIFWPINSRNIIDFPYSKNLSETTLAIPIDHRFNINDMKYVIKILKII